jgi:hypothetical protein
MSSKADLFKTIMRAELEDSLTSYKAMEAEIEKNFQAGGITNYVHNENIVLMKRLQHAMSHMMEFMDKDLQGDTPEELAEKICAEVRRDVLVESPKAIIAAVDRKIDKVLGYIALA